MRYGFLCKVSNCTMVTQTEKDMKGHIISHKIFPCQLCLENGKYEVFTDLRLYGYHIQTMHGSYSEEEKKQLPEQCDMCQGRFKDVRGLNGHESQKHKVPASTTCDICHIEFGRPNERSRHHRIYHSEKAKSNKLKYTCFEKFCDVSFKKESSLKRHHTRIHEAKKRKCSSKEKSNKCKEVLLPADQIIDHLIV